MRAAAMLFLGVTSAAASMACDLKVESAWVREAPPNASTLAGYAKLINTGNAPLRIKSFQSQVFGKIEAHETLNENGVSKMRAVGVLEIPAHGAVEFSPGGKHLMLMNPKQALKKGDAVAIVVEDGKSCSTRATFVVGSSAATPPAEQGHDTVPGMEHHH